MEELSIEDYKPYVFRASMIQCCFSILVFFSGGNESDIRKYLAVCSKEDSKIIYD